jgi:hypothetical protein
VVVGMPLYEPRPALGDALRGHPVAVAVNQALSRAIVLAYRGLRAARDRG